MYHVYDLIHSKDVVFSSFANTNLRAERTVALAKNVSLITSMSMSKILQAFK